MGTLQLLEGEKPGTGTAHAQPKPAREFADIKWRVFNAGSLTGFGQSISRRRGVEMAVSETNGAAALTNRLD